MKKEYIAAYQEGLLQWYDKNRRVLPWREDSSPYKVWISEIMLQQTKVDTVIPYFLRFMEEIPSIFALANVSEDKLLKLWEGLGYYNRARNLKKAAQVILADYNGRMPTQVVELQTLPGIGPYTAGAIASIAFAQKTPAIDGNVLRIVSRITVNTGNTKERKVQKEIEEFIWMVLPDKRTGEFNQALMDLGATICIPKGTPKCSICPLSNLCKGNSRGIAGTLPVKSAKKKRKVEERTIFILSYRGKIAIRKRPSTGLLSKLWEYPNVEGFTKENEINFLIKSWGLYTKSIIELNSSTHLFSHLEWQMKGYYLEVEVVNNHNDFTWASRKEIIKKHSIPTAFKTFTNEITQLEDNSIEAI